MSHTYLKYVVYGAITVLICGAAGWLACDWWLS